MDKPLVHAVEALVGFEGILVAFGMFLGSWRFEAILGFLGYPIGLFAIIHSMHRMGTRPSLLAMTAIIILFVSRVTASGSILCVTRVCTVVEFETATPGLLTVLQTSF